VTPDLENRHTVMSGDAHTASRPTRLWHGGAPGLSVGGRILPSCMTGAPSNADYGGGAVCRRDRVYLTVSREQAAFYAALHPSGRGQVYEVEPVGEVVPDPDCNEPGFSWEAEEALIKRIRQVPASIREAALAHACQVCARRPR
jgi:rifampin ADP-ribosylating transferase